MTEEIKLPPLPEPSRPGEPKSPYPAMRESYWSQKEIEQFGRDAVVADRKARNEEEGDLLTIAHMDGIYTGRRQCEAEKWLPIETAPKDAQQVVLVVCGGNVYQAKRNVYGKSSPYRYQSSGGAYIIATHWMPMPAPPIDEERM